MEIAEVEPGERLVGVEGDCRPVFSDGPVSIAGSGARDPQVDADERLFGVDGEALGERGDRAGVVAGPVVDEALGAQDIRVGGED